jgi:hypothetical protein
LKDFNAKSFYLRTGLLGKQWLQKVPNYQAQKQLDEALVEIYEAGWLGDCDQELVNVFVAEDLVSALASGGVLKASRSNKKWPAKQEWISPDQKTGLTLAWIPLAAEWIKELPQKLAETEVVAELAQGASALMKTEVTPEHLVKWLLLEDTLTQASGIKDYSVAYLNLCSRIYHEAGGWVPLASVFDPKGSKSSGGFVEAEQDLASFLSTLKSDGLA